MERKKRWKEWFHSTPEHRIMVEIDDDFILENKKLFKEQESDIDVDKLANFVINGVVDEESDKESDFLHHVEKMYGFLHSLFICTTQGLHKMHELGKNDVFETCSRVFCKKAMCLPIGIETDQNTVQLKFYCTKCRDIYNCRSPDLQNVDGSCFGSEWIEKYMKEFHETATTEEEPAYEPRIFGFRIKNPLQRFNEEEEANE